MEQKGEDLKRQHREPQSFTEPETEDSDGEGNHGMMAEEPVQMPAEPSVVIQAPAQKDQFEKDGRDSWRLCVYYDNRKVTFEMAAKWLGNGISKAKKWAKEPDKVLLRLSLVKDPKHQHWEAARIDGKGGSRVALSTNFVKFRDKVKLDGLRTTQPPGTRLYRVAPASFHGIGGIKEFVANLADPVPAIAAVI
jgi:hypothetical protein